MMWRATLVILGLLVSCGAIAQQPQQRTRNAPQPPAEPCDLSGQFGSCASCPSLMAALRLPDAPTGDNGPDTDGVAWSPLYVAFRLNCPDAARLLLSRGANPERGGKQGALLAEVAAQHFANPDQRPAAVQSAAIEWVTLLSKVRPFDLDAPIGDGMPSTRSTWTSMKAAGPLPPGSMVIWSRIEGLSANFPVLVDGGERTNVDFPAPDTGITRPSETAVSRGVEAMLAAYSHGGMIEVTTRLQACWAEQKPPAMASMKWRWHFDTCAAMDVAAGQLDAGVSAELKGPRLEFFLDQATASRLAVLNEFQKDGLQLGPYLKSLKRSVTTWLPIQYAIRSKT